ncbi:hypothetical protein KFE80_02735 [bacterium SCSIO 12696]|nr:hypothetical protein KFE80_02735 [bacterium SCSIO 12696]
MRFAILLIGIVLTSGCSGVKKQENISILPVPPFDRLYVKNMHPEKPLFLGKIDRTKEDGRSGSIMYPGQNGAAFLASVLTHAAINSGVQKARKKEKQERANKVWESYQGVTNQTSFDALVPSSLKLDSGKVIEAFPYSLKEPAENSWVAEVSPVFYMSDKKNSLTLKSEVSFSQSSNPSSKKIKVTAIYISDENSMDLTGVHSSEQSHLIDIFKSMFSRTLAMASNFSEGLYDSGQKEKSETLRYLEDSQKKVERGKVISINDERVVFFTLRDEVKSAPLYFE